MKVARISGVIATTLALTAGGLLALSGPAAAAPLTKTVAPSFGGSTNPHVTFDTTAMCDDCFPDAFGPGPGSWAFGAQVTTQVTSLSYAPASTADVTYDDSRLRQGQTMPITDKLAPLIGSMTAAGHLNIQYGAFNDSTGGTSFSPAATLTAANEPFTLPFLCSMPLPGDPPVSCTSGAVSVPVATITVIPAIYPAPGLSIVLSVNVSVSATINGAGVATVRSVEVVGGGAPSTAPLTFGGSSPSTLTDSVHFSCTQPAGNGVQYSFTNLAYAPDVDLSTTTAVHYEATITGIPTPIPGVTFDEALFGGNIGSITSSAAGISLPLTAPDQTIDLGTLAKNNVAPVVDAGNGGVYSGDEGQPVQFDGSGSSSVCGFPTLRWDFSDGGVAFGAHPVHTFGGSGLYSGQLTATDATGLTSSTTYSVNVTNGAPAVHAGPNVGGAWGIPIALNGSATDPGIDDQSTLTYRWDFGDGSPSATGGAHATHRYSTPGTYTATLQSCDRYSACASDTTSVTIRKRDVAASYVGDFTGTYDTAGALTASLTDEFGNPVQGRAVSFSYNGSPVGNASTNSSGMASRAFTPMLDAGNYAVSASFAGDALYNSANNAGTFAEGVKATAVTYTGALTGGPNKAVTLSAVLKDAAGLALAGRTITFRLGTQTVSAITDANGVASTSLKLAQKNGKYPLTATYLPAGADANRYSGNSASVTFNLQAK
ncbi:MAG: hypothetical protein QOF87_4325 [Pseudonocardiales bacterium]|nr:hypothetical protein [Pseudonocardiales bacterium]